MSGKPQRARDTGKKTCQQTQFVPLCTHSIGRLRRSPAQICSVCGNQHIREIEECDKSIVISSCKTAKDIPFQLKDGNKSTVKQKRLK